MPPFAVFFSLTGLSFTNLFSLSYTALPSLLFIAVKWSRAGKCACDLLQGGIKFGNPDSYRELFASSHLKIQPKQGLRNTQNALSGFFLGEFPGIPGIGIWKLICFGLMPDWAFRESGPRPFLTFLENWIKSVSPESIYSSQLDPYPYLLDSESVKICKAFPG